MRESQAWNEGKIQFNGFTYLNVNIVLISILAIVAQLSYVVCSLHTNNSTKMSIRYRNDNRQKANENSSPIILHDYMHEKRIGSWIMKLFIHWLVLPAFINNYRKNACKQLLHFAHKCRQMNFTNDLFAMKDWFDLHFFFSSFVLLHMNM